MASKIINQEGTMCDAPDCEKFFFGERPKSWKTLEITDPKSKDHTAFDACSVKHAHVITDEYVTIS